VKAVVAPLLLALGAFSLGGGILHAARHPGAGSFRRTATTEVEPGAFPKLLRSGTRTEVIPAPPVRIASLTVTSDEILTVLVGPGRLVAVSRFARDAAISTCTDRVPEGTPTIRGVDPERIISMEPDLVFVAHYTQESALRILGSATIPVVRLRDVHAFEDVIANVRLVAAAVGEDSRGEALLIEMRERLRSVEAQIRGRAAPHVLYVSAGGYTTGARTLLDEKIRRAGGRNVAAAANLVGNVSVSLDLLVALDPDVIIVPRWSEDGAGPIREITDSPAWRTSRVVREGRVHAIAAGVLTSESQDAVLGVESLARVLHPEAFSS
jgi:iron complex transport system substrate-binding protein